MLQFQPKIRPPLELVELLPLEKSQLPGVWRAAVFADGPDASWSFWQHYKLKGLQLEVYTPRYRDLGESCGPVELSYNFQGKRHKTFYQAIQHFNRHRRWLESQLTPPRPKLEILPV